MTNDEMQRVRIAGEMQTVRSIVLTMCFFYIAFAYARCLFANGNCSPEMWEIRIGIISFIIMFYALTYRDIFIYYSNIWLLLFSVVNAATLLGMQIMSEGATTIGEHPYIVMPMAIMVLALNYVMPIRIQYAAAGGVLISIIYIGITSIMVSPNDLISVFMYMAVSNMLFSQMAYSKEILLKYIWDMRPEKKSDELNELMRRL